MTVFVHDRPVTGRGHYFGREGLVRSLADGFARHRSFAVCGGPKTGRTSTLHQVVAVTYERWQRRPTVTRVVPVPFDLAKVPAGGERQLVPMLWQKILTCVRDPRVCGEAPPKPPPREMFRKSSKPWEHLIELAEEMWNDLKGSAAWCEYGILLDNADLLFERHLRPCLEPLAALVEKSQSWAPGSMSLFGGRALREHLYDPDAELHFLRPMSLGCLRDPDARNLAKTGLPDAPTELLDALVATTGRHPYILQRVLAELELRGMAAGVEGAVDAAAPDILRLFDDIWETFDFGRGVTYRGAYAAPEHALMQLFLDYGAAGCDIKTAERELGLRPLKEFAEFLEYIGVAERVLRNDDVIFRTHMELWNIWYSDRIMR